MANRYQDNRSYQPNNWRSDNLGNSQDARMSYRFNSGRSAGNQRYNTRKGPPSNRLDGGNSLPWTFQGRNNGRPGYGAHAPASRAPAPNQSRQGYSSFGNPLWNRDWQQELEKNDGTNPGSGSYSEVVRKEQPQPASKEIEPDVRCAPPAQESNNPFKDLPMQDTDEENVHEFGMQYWKPLPEDADSETLLGFNIPFVPIPPIDTALADLPE